MASSSVSKVASSLAKLIDSFDPNSDAFKIYTHEPAQGPDKPPSAHHGNTVSTSPYVFPEDIVQQTVNWYDTVIVSSGVSEARRNYPLELAAKQCMYDFADHDSAAPASSASSSPSFSPNNAIGRSACLLDMIFILRSHNKVEPTLPHLLLEELFEIQTIGWCQQFWPYLVSRNQYITHNLSGSRAPGTTLIRFGNALLRRLSKTQHAQFSGEILMYLAHAFPLTEKSALNIRGNYNTENITYYEGDGRSSEQQENEEQQEDVEMKDSDQQETAKSTPTPEEQEQADPEKAKKDAMYRRFWSLQDIFCDPTLLFAQGQPGTDKMAELKATLATVLAELKKWELQYNTQRDRENEIRRQEMDLSSDDEEDEDDDEDDKDDANTQGQSKSVDDDSTTTSSSMPSSSSVLFVPKWLTRRDLFELQLKDISFRRAVLTQMSVLIEFLLGFENTPNSTNSILAKMTTPPTNKSVLYNFTLDSTDASFLSDLKRQIRRSTFQTIDLQPQYLRTVDAVLSRDRFWQTWKLQSCPPFGLPGITRQTKTIAAFADLRTKKVTPTSKTEDTTPSVIEQAKAKLQMLQKPRPRFAHSMGTPQLSQIWRIPTGTERLKDPINYAIKGADEYYHEVKQVESEFRDNYEVEVELSDEEDGEEKEATPKPKKTVKKLLASTEELREHNEAVGSKTWRGLRAARAMDLWSQFGKIGPNGGLSGLFEEQPAAEPEKPEEEKKENDEEIPDAAANEEPPQDEASSEEPEKVEEAPQDTPKETPAAEQSDDDDVIMVEDVQEAEQSQAASPALSELDHDEKESKDEPEHSIRRVSSESSLTSLSDSSESEHEAAEQEDAQGDSNQASPAAESNNHEENEKEPSSPPPPPPPLRRGRSNPNKENLEELPPPQRRRRSSAAVEEQEHDEKLQEPSSRKRSRTNDNDVQLVREKRTRRQSSTSSQDKRQPEGGDTNDDVSKVN